MGYLLEKKIQEPVSQEKYQALEIFINLLHKGIFLSCDDIDLIKSPKLPQSLPRSISNEQASTLIDSIGNGRPDWKHERQRTYFFDVWSWIKN